MTSDRGHQFTSDLWASIAQLLCTTLHQTTAYHPQANGLVERFLKTALRTRLTGPNWTKVLPWVLLGIRTAPKEDLGCSSAEMVYGAPLTVPGDFISGHGFHSYDLLACVRDRVCSLVPVPTSRHGATLTSVAHPFSAYTVALSKSSSRARRVLRWTSEERQRRSPLTGSNQHTLIQISPLQLLNQNPVDALRRFAITQTPLPMRQNNTPVLDVAYWYHVGTVRFLRGVVERKIL